MHDPMTLAHSIKNPFLPARKVKGPDGNVSFSYRKTLIDIWHVDPETDGSDDSCGWFAPRLSKDQQARIKSMASDEAREPWFQRAATEKIEDPIAATVLMEGAIDAVIAALRVKVRRGYARSLAYRLIHNPSDHARSLLAYKQFYHGNTADDDYWRKEHAGDLFHMIARNVLRDHRPWYKHPRWHVHHWKINITPVRNFQRWAFSRCCKCGGRFPYNYAPISTGWFGTGPRWFKSEEGVYHHDCRTPKQQEAGSAPPVEIA